MTAAKKRAEEAAKGARGVLYAATVESMEPDIAMVGRDAALTSIAISLKRIADVLEGRRAEGGLS